MDVAALFSGGKDSTYAVYLALKRGLNIKFLLTVFPREGSWYFHHPCIELTKIQAKLMGIKQVRLKGRRLGEEERKDLERLIRKVKDKVDAIICGVIASNFQKKRIKTVCDEYDLKLITPLWKKDRYETLLKQIEEGFEIIVTGVASDGFNKEWLGRKLDWNTINELLYLSKKFGVDIAGEGGEYETLVLDCPIFSGRIVLREIEKIWDSKTNSGFIKIKRFDIIEKPGCRNQVQRAGLER